MEYLIGVGLAVVVCAVARLTGVDRERVFYPKLLTTDKKCTNRQAAKRSQR